MAVNKKAVVHTATGLVENIILADDTFVMPNKTLVLATNATQIDGIWDGSSFEAAPARIIPIEETNRESITAKAVAALAANATYQAIGAPTNAQVAAQVLLLTKENNAIIRLLVRALDTTVGT